MDALFAASTVRERTSDAPDECRHRITAGGRTCHFCRCLDDGGPPTIWFSFFLTENRRVGGKVLVNQGIVGSRQRSGSKQESMSRTQGGLEEGCKRHDAGGVGPFCSSCPSL
jgi:hypothetical protein